MNPIRRYTMHRWNSRHNPLTTTALLLTLCALATAVICALLEAESIRVIAMADKAMIAELILVVEGKAKMVERTGNYEVHYSVNKTTYEVK